MPPPSTTRHVPTGRRRTKPSGAWRLQIGRWREEASALTRPVRRRPAVAPPPVLPARILGGAAQDLRYACRLLRREPRSAAITVALLAIAIGATTALFSVAYGVLGRPLPWPGADRIVVLDETRGGHAAALRSLQQHRLSRLARRRLDDRRARGLVDAPRHAERRRRAGADSHRGRHRDAVPGARRPPAARRAVPRVGRSAARRRAVGDAVARSLRRRSGDPRTSHRTGRPALHGGRRDAGQRRLPRPPDPGDRAARGSGGIVERAVDVRRRRAAASGCLPG